MSNELHGDVKERQRLAFESPIWRVAQAQDELFAHIHHLPTGLFLKSVLTVDCFDKPWSWHVAVGLLRRVGKPAKAGQKTEVLKREMLECEAVPLTTWSREEYQLAMTIARELLAGVGQAQSVSWTNASVYQFTLQAWRDLSADERVNVEAKMAELSNVGAFQFTGRDRYSDLILPPSVVGH